MFRASPLSRHPRATFRASAAGSSTFSLTLGPPASVLLSLTPCRVAFASSARFPAAAVPCATVVVPCTVAVVPCTAAASIDRLACFSLAYPSPSPDYLLFFTLACCSFFALHRLDELVDADDPQRHFTQKHILHPTVTLSPADFRYSLPSHKADRSFEGNLIIGSRLASPPIDPVAVFTRYFTSRDAPPGAYLPYPWLTAQLLVQSTSELIPSCSTPWHLVRILRPLE